MFLVRYGRHVLGFGRVEVNAEIVNKKERIYLGRDLLFILVMGLLQKTRTHEEDISFVVHFRLKVYVQESTLEYQF